MISRTKWGVALVLVAAAGCAAPAEHEDEAMGSAEARFTDSRDAVDGTWGTNLWRSPATGRPTPSWPGAFDQPDMKSGPGSCGFAAVANLAAQLTSLPAAEQAPVTPWEMLDQQAYNTIWGILPSDARRLLDKTFADADRVGSALKGTRFTWRNEGANAAAEAAYGRLEASLDAGIPFIALVRYGHDEGTKKEGFNHYVVVVAHTAGRVTIAHWGRYESVAKGTFLAWWRAHTFWSYAGIYPDRASALGEDR